MAGYVGLHMCSWKEGKIWGAFCDLLINWVLLKFVNVVLCFLKKIKK